jgi:cytochrome c-type biogenesis protein CcmH/NrfG
VTACPSCGAAVRDGDARCPLCGTDLATSSTPDDVTATPASLPDPADATTLLVCAACGHRNVPGARFCNACGAELGAASDEATAAPARRPARRPSTAAPPETRPEASAAGRRALLFVGSGIAVVVALYGISTLSNRAPAPATPETAAGTATAPGAGASAAAVPDGTTPPLADSLQRAADALEAQNSASGWYEAGRYYLTAGFDAQQAGDAQGVLWVRRAVADFEKSLAIEPDPDVRFALAEAAQFDPADPMRPVVELRTLLAANPDHVGGNFLLGERRMLIGRLDSARVSFQRVVALAPAGDPLRDRAVQMIAQLDQAGAPTRGVPDGAGAPPPAGTPGVGPTGAAPR